MTLDLFSDTSQPKPGTAPKRRVILYEGARVLSIDRGDTQPPPGQEGFKVIQPERPAETALLAFPAGGERDEWLRRVRVRLRNAMQCNASFRLPKATHTLQPAP